MDFSLSYERERNAFRTSRGVTRPAITARESPRYLELQHLVPVNLALRGSPVTHDDLRVRIICAFYTFFFPLLFPIITNFYMAFGGACYLRLALRDWKVM